MFQWHTCVSRGNSTREQENPRVRGEVGIVNHDIQQFLPSLIAQPTAITTNHRGDYPFSHSLPTTIPGKLLRHPRNLIIVELILSPILFTAGIHFPSVLHNQDYPKVCPASLNLPNAGDSFAGISSLSSCSLFSPTRDLIALI
jgi:hypothetical protein